jgi:predicted amidophosphoribosyltransferase
VPFCPKCKSKISEEDKFCSVCRNKISKQKLTGSKEFDFK